MAERNAAWVTALALVHCVLATQVLGAEMTDGVPPEAELARIRALRQKALARPRRIWFNHDGCDASSFPSTRLRDGKGTPQALLEVRTTPLAETQVDTLSYCTISSGFSNFTHRTQVGHILTSPSATDGRVNITQDLIDQGTDPLEVMVGFCHANDMECFWSMRMNDTHDAAWRPGTGHRLFPRLKEEHPEYLVGAYDRKPPFGTWTSVNYARPEIRELCYRFIEEVCRNYDVDGVEMDFFRHLCFFKSVAEGGKASPAELGMMTDLVRRVRLMTEREGVRRGRPILVAARVPDSVEFAMGLGLDVRRWLQQGLVDCLIGSGYFRFDDWTRLVELGHTYGVKVYPCLSESRIRRVKEAYRARCSDDCYRGRAMNVWAAGADGVYIFNEYNAGRRYLHDIGAVDTLRAKSKLYFVTVRNGSPSRYLSGGNTYVNRQLLSPEDAIPIARGQRVTVDVVVGEDFAWVRDADVEPEVLCRLDIDGLTPDDGQPEVTLNGRTLTPGTSGPAGLLFAVDPGWLERGLNRVEVFLRPADDALVDDGAPREREEWDAVYAGDHVMKMPSQLPWRRLFNNRNWVEETRGGALFLADRGVGPNEWANIVYPWAATASGTAVAEASVKVVASNEPLGVCMRVSNGRSVEYLTLEPGEVGLRFAGLSVSRDTADAFHTYRVAARRDDILVYIDGELALDGRGRLTTSATDEQHWLAFSYGKRDWNKRSFTFGSASGPGTGEALWRGIKLRDGSKSWTDLSFRVSYPVQAKAVPAWDVELDGQALPGDPWRVDRLVGATLAEVRDGCLYVADRGTEAGDYLYFSYPWDVRPETGGTVEARVKLLSGWCAIRSGDGVHSERLEIHPRSIQLRGGSGAIYAMDTTGEFHTYRMVTKGQDVEVYVDGKLRIDGTGLYTKPAANGRNDTGFGCANSPSEGEAMWEWVRLTRRAY